MQIFLWCKYFIIHYRKNIRENIILSHKKNIQKKKLNVKIKNYLLACRK